MKKPLIIVITNNRPQILKRCIRNTIKNSEIAKKSIWLIIDDSNKLNSKQNSILLQGFVKKGLEIFHLTSAIQKNIFHVLTHQSIKNLRRSTFGKTFSRDISGLRNLGLICSTFLQSPITFLIDDDILIQKKSNFLDMVIQDYKKMNNYIVGTTFGGVIDESYFGRLTYVCNKGITAVCNQNKPIKSKDYLQVSTNPLWIDIKPQRNRNSVVPADTNDYWH